MVEEILQELTLDMYIENDTFLLLESIMIRMAGTYCPDLPSNTSSTNRMTKKLSFSYITSPSDTLKSPSSPLVQQMNSIHHHILSRCDPLTARHLSRLGIEPEMIVLRWVRVLMAREFEMAQVWQIWDAIFSLTPCDFSFINLLCVAAVREYREEILVAQDPTSILVLLRDISEKVEADRLVDNARELYEALVFAASVEAVNDTV